jgi:hypothetical protein
MEKQAALHERQMVGQDGYGEPVHNTGVGNGVHHNHTANNV